MLGSVGEFSKEVNTQRRIDRQIAALTLFMQGFYKRVLQGTEQLEKERQIERQQLTLVYAGVLQERSPRNWTPKEEFLYADPDTGFALEKRDPDSGFALEKREPDPGFALEKRDPILDSHWKNKDPDPGFALKKRDPDSGFALRKKDPDFGFALEKKGSGSWS